MIGATDLTIDCNTTDPNANVTLLLNNVRLPVGGRVTLHKQVFTIHNISTGDPRTYKCVTSSGSSMTVFCQTVFTYEGVTQIEIWITLTPIIQLEITFSWKFQGVQVFEESNWYLGSMSLSPIKTWIFFFTPEFLPVLNLKFHFIIHFLDGNYFCEGEEVMNAFLLNF